MATRRSFPAMLALLLAAAGVAVLTLAVPACGSREKKAQGRSYKLGERFNVASLVYTVENASWHSKLGEGETEHLPRSQYLLVTLTVTNSGGSTISVPPAHLVAADDSQIPELASLEGVPGWLGAIRTLSPAQTIRGFVAFDVPQAPYKLRLADPLDPDEEGVVLVALPVGT